MSQRTAYWRGVIDDWSRSGLSQAEYCRRHRLAAVTFSWWKGRLSREAGGATSRREVQAGSLAAGAGFVELRWPDALARAGYEVALSNGRVVRVPEGFDAGTLTRLIAAVEAAGAHLIEDPVSC